MRKQDVKYDLAEVEKLWDKITRAQARAKTPIAKEHLKKIESAFGDLYSKLDMERINPNLED